MIKRALCDGSIILFLFMGLLKIYGYITRIIKQHKSTKMVSHTALHSRLGVNTQWTQRIIWSRKVSINDFPLRIAGK